VRPALRARKGLHNAAALSAFIYKATQPLQAGLCRPLPQAAVGYRVRPAGAPTPSPVAKRHSPGHHTPCTHSTRAGAPPEQQTGAAHVFNLQGRQRATKARPAASGMHLYKNNLQLHLTQALVHCRGARNVRGPHTSCTHTDTRSSIPRSGTATVCHLPSTRQASACT
jgi:hypothetical protein